MFPISPVYLWFFLMIIFFVIEMVSTTLISIWFAAGALGSLIFSLLFPQAITLQIITFIVISGITLYFTRPILAKKLLKQTPTNADMLVGAQGIVISDITPLAVGRVKAGGLSWQAKSAEEIKSGETCTIIKIEGVTLIVEKQPVTL